MGMFGGIISGAMGGAGQAGVQAENVNQQLQGQLNNAETLAQINANLDVQKQASIMRMAQDNKLALLNDPRLNTPAAPTTPQSVPVDPTMQSSINSKQPPAPINLTPTGSTPTAVMGLDTSKLSPEVIAALQAKDPDAFANGVANNQKFMSAMSQPGSTVLIDGALVGGNLSTDQPSQINYPVPDTASISGSGYRLNPTTGIFEQTPQLQREVMKAQLLGGDASAADVLKNNQPTEAEKLIAAYQRVDPNSPQGIALGKQIKLLGYTAPTSIRGEVYADPTGLHSLPGAAPEGSMKVQNADGSWSIVPVSGGIQAIQSEETAKAGAKQNATDNAETWTAQKARANQSAGNIALINTMEPLLNNFTSGNGAQNLADWKSFANTHGIPVDKNATDAAQEFKKYANQMIVAQRSAMGASGTDAAQAAQEASSANMGIGNDPNRNILQYMRANEQGLQAFATAKNNYLRSNGNDMSKAYDFDNAFNSTYDPRILMFNNMNPTQKQAFVQNLVKNGQYDTFENKMIGYNKLMGAFQ
jgi:hypothetical protein